MTTLTLPTGHVVLFDEDDVALIAQYRWCVSSAKSTFYAQSAGSGRPTVLMHRLILGAPAGRLVDHRNRNGLDNRRMNLRLSTRSQNAGNAAASARNSSGYKGVSWRRAAGRWQAYITVDRRRRHLGFYDDPWEAAQAYNAAAIEAWGEFARLNVRAAA